jgi:hypothetical protein
LLASRPRKSNDDYSGHDRASLEVTANGPTHFSGTRSIEEVGLAKAEIIRRDREYAEQQEQSRRAYEDQREASRRDFEIRIFQAAGNRAAVQQQHEEKLARMQADAAREAATIQARATEQAAERQVKIARWAAVAAMAAAVAAFISLATPWLR